MTHALRSVFDKRIVVYFARISFTSSVDSKTSSMNANSKHGQTRKPLSRVDMIRYLSRHKLKKKQPLILPRTFANTQGLSTAHLQPVSQPETKKPIISTNVKARLECDLEHLLENQKNTSRRVRAPESYISIQTDRSKLPKLPNVLMNEQSAELQNKNREIDKSKAPKQINLTSSTKNSGKSSSSTLRPNQTKGVVKMPSTTSQIDRSFNTNVNQIRAGNGSASLALSGVPSEFFELSTTQRRAEQKDWSFDEPKLAEPSSKHFL